MSRYSSGNRITFGLALLFSLHGAGAGAVTDKAIASPVVVSATTLTSDAGQPETTVTTVTTDGDRPYPSASLIPGRIVVKFRSDGLHAVTECAEASFKSRRIFQDATADHSESLDRLGREVGVRSVRALLPERFGLSTAAARRRANDVRERLAKARRAAVSCGTTGRCPISSTSTCSSSIDRSTLCRHHGFSQATSMSSTRFPTTSQRCRPYPTIPTSVRPGRGGSPTTTSGA